MPSFADDRARLGDRALRDLEPVGPREEAALRPQRRGQDRPGRRGRRWRGTRGAQGRRECGLAAQDREATAGRALHRALAVGESLLQSGALLGRRREAQLELAELALELGGGPLGVSRPLRVGLLDLLRPAGAAFGQHRRIHHGALGLVRLRLLSGWRGRR